jgi:hypothetical protein
MVGFMDESGDAGFQFHRHSSRYFVVMLVLFGSEAEAQRVGTRLTALKAEIGKPTMEFHFTNTDGRGSGMAVSRNKRRRKCPRSLSD